VNDLRIPDLEVIIGAAGNDSEVFDFYKRDDIHQGYEIVSIIGGKVSVVAMRACLQDCLASLNNADWHSMAELDESEDQDETGAPF